MNHEVNKPVTFTELIDRFNKRNTIFENLNSKSKNINIPVWDRILNEAKKDSIVINAAILLNAKLEAIDHKKRAVFISFDNLEFELFFAKRWHTMSKYLLSVFGVEYRFVLI